MLGSLDVLIANIGILTASSAALTLSHIGGSRTGYALAALLGLAFLLNQVNETYSTLALSGIEDQASVLFCLSTHLSHLLLSLVVFAVLAADTGIESHSSLLVFVSAYWHLVEVV